MPLETRTFSPTDGADGAGAFNRGRRDDAEPSDAERRAAAQEKALGAKPAVPRFDLFDGPDGRPVTPDNLAAAPALPGAVQENLPATTTTPEAAARNGTLRATPQAGNAAGPLDPLMAARNRGLPPPDLASAAEPIRGSRVDSILGRQNLAVTALRGTIPIAEDDPFAPVGMRAGTFVLYSTLEQSLGASSNLTQSADGKAGLFSETILSGRLLSDWSEHEFEMNALASYRRNFAGELKSEPRIAVDGRLRLDVDRLTTATLRGAIEYRQEDPIDLDPTDSLTERPDIVTFSGGAEVERRFGRALVGLDGSAVREARSTPTATGDIVVLDDSYTTYTAALRTGYDLSPAIRPYVQGSVGRRLFDASVDLAGLERDSTISSLRTGVEFDLGEKFLGEIAAGYAWNAPDAGAIDATASPTLDGRLAWSPQRGTDLVLTAGTNFEPDTDGSGTSTLYEGSLALRHRLTHRTDLTATLAASYRDSEVETEIETSHSAEAGFTYWLNRTLAFTGLLRHEGLNGKAPGSDYTAETAKIGLKLQR